MTRVSVGLGAGVCCIDAVERAVLAIQQYSVKTCCIVQYSARAVSRAHCIAMQQYSQYTNAAIHHNTVYNTIHSPSAHDALEQGAGDVGCLIWPLWLSFLS